MSPTLALNRLGLICLGLSIVCAACDAATPASSRERPAEAGLLPEDLTSNAGPLLVATNPGGSRGYSAEEVLMLARQAQLVRLADLEPVAFQLIEGLTAPLSEFPAVEVRPLEPLEPVWHLLTLMDLPPWADIPYGARTPELGVYGVRFHPESNPVVRAVGFNLRAREAAIEFSEPIAYTPEAVAESLRVTQQGRPCRWTNPGGPSFMPGPGFSFLCSVPFEETETTVELQPGLTSPEGAPLTLFTGEDSFTATITGEEASQLTDYWLTW